jgi:oligopeptide transport system ATP-binding protein
VDAELDVVTASLSDLRKIRGSEIGMVFQDPMSSLNPVFNVGSQVMEPLMLHQGMSKHDARRESIRLLKTVGIPEPEQRFSSYPHQLSGGMRQRAMIAVALSCQPSLLLADEPTTALDVTIQAQILSLLMKLKDEFGASIILITHDISIVAGTCSRILVMYAGRIIEETTDEGFFLAPRHPYSRALLESLPRVDARRRLKAIRGQPPDLLTPPAGCAYAERCERATDKCLAQDPELENVSGGRVACHYPLE